VNLIGIKKKYKKTEITQTAKGIYMEDNGNIRSNQSPEIKDLIASLAKAQGSMKPAVFNKTNPHFKSRYADFSSCMDACRQPLSENGLAVIQSCETIDGKLLLVTTLAHTSGQWIKSEFPIISAKMDSQGIGSAMTYAKRYSLCGMCGVVADEDVDDDGETAVGRGKTKTTPKPEAETFESEMKWTQDYISRFEKEDQFLANEYLETVRKHFNWSVVQAVKELFKDEHKMFEKFNQWKSKRKVAE